MAGREDLARGPYPREDGWGWLYRLFAHMAPPDRQLRRTVCWYFWPKAIERWRGGLLYRSLGVHLFGSLLPTGGAWVRRLTGARMRPYALEGSSVGAARAFFYRTCVFETAHLPFLLLLIGLTVHRASIGRFDLAVQNTVVNLVVNAYPIMHHRRTRTRIVELLGRRRSGRPPGRDSLMRHDPERP